MQAVKGESDVNVWQKPLQYCKVISLQLIKIIGGGEGESGRKWVARGLSVIMMSQVTIAKWRKVLDIQKLESSVGKNWKSILLLPNIHKAVLPNNVDELVLTPAISLLAEWGFWGLLFGLSHHLGWCILNKEWWWEIPGPLGSEDVLHKWSTEHLLLWISGGSLATRNWFNFADYSRAQERKSGGHSISVLFRLFWKWFISLPSP